MIKVCHVTSVHPKEDVRIFQKECVSLSKEGYDVTLVQQGDSYEKDGVHVVGFGKIGSNRVKRMLFTAKAAYQKALEEDADIYHLHDPELLPYALKLKKKGKKVIFDSHERYTDLMSDKPYLPTWAKGVIAFTYGTYEKYVLSKIDGVIFPCLKNGKNPFEGMCAHIADVNNVPLLEELYERYDPKAEKYPRSICHVGSLSHNRGITHMIEAAEIANVRAYIGGSFSPPEYQQELERKSSFEHVEYLGRLNREQVIELLNHSQIGMANLLNVGQYNQYDNLATKVYEYMAMGLPVILSSSAYNDRIMEKLHFGICVDPENVKEIADAIQYLLDNPAEARRMGENGRRAIREEFNWDMEEKKLLAFYENILKN